MKSWILALAVLSLAIADQYAIVIQGDRGYGNYSDSANSCRAYDDLILSGLDPEKVIYMANEDTLTNPRNPWKNMLFTLPDPTGPGKDHAYLCKDNMDYKGKDIEPDVVLALLRQDREEVKRLTGYEDPKVFNTTNSDTIFIYYTDHGYEGGVGCGSSVITRDELLGVLFELHKKNKYHKILFYLEACESGSMFEGLSYEYNIYALTSADSTTPAWCDHCPPDDIVNGKHIDTCMSMFFDNSFQGIWEDQPFNCTVGQLSDMVHDEVKEKMPSQTVCRFGQYAIGYDSIKQFIGPKVIPRNMLRAPRTPSSSPVRKDKVERHVAMWRAIRAGDEANMASLNTIVTNDAWREVETMRLGVQILGEKEAYLAFGDDSRVVKSTECSRSLSTEIIRRCDMTFPLLQGTKNIIHAICATKVDTASIDWAKVCM